MHRRLIPIQQAFLKLQQRVETFVRRTFTGRPRALAATVAVLAIAVLSTGGGVAWFAYDLTTGLPNRQALRDIGDMVQSTTIFDASDRPAFTIFKEQRIEVPLEKVSQNVIKAVISVEDQRFFDHSGIDAVRIGGAAPEEPAVGPPRRRRQHHHAAARAADVPEPGQDLPPQAQGNHRRRLPREPVFETGDPRDVSQQGVLRRRPARRRGRRPRLFRQARGRARGRRSGAPRRPHPVAVELRADGQPRPRRRAPERRPPDDGQLGGDRCRRGRAREVRAGHDQQRARDQGDLRPLLQGAGAARAGRALRLAARLPGRPSRLHDDRQRPPEGGRSDARRRAAGHRAPARASSTRSARSRRRRGAALPRRPRRPSTSRAR